MSAHGRVEHKLLTSLMVMALSGALYAFLRHATPTPRHPKTARNILILSSNMAALKGPLRHYATMGALSGNNEVNF